MKKLILISFLLIKVILFSNQIDSLQKFYKIELTEPVNIDIEIDKISKSIEKGNFDYSIALGEKLLNFKNVDFKNKAKIYSELGVAYWYNGNTSKGNNYFFKSIEIAKIEDDSLTLAKSYFNLGFTNLANGEYHSSLNNFFEAEKYCIDSNSIQKYKIKDYISYCFIVQEKFDFAEQYVKEAFKISTKINDRTHFVNMSNSLGYYYLVSKKNRFSSVLFYKCAIYCYKNRL